MIVRPDHDSYLLIRQPDHAAMAADIISHWQADGFPARPTRDVVLTATREHDCGWAVEDEAPTVNPETGEPWDFIHLPKDARQAVWARAMALLSDTPHVAALVAQHAITAYARFEGDPEWREFFRAMSDARDRRVVEAGVAFDGFLGDYALIRAADLISLTLCLRWQDTFEIDYYRGIPADASVDGVDLVLQPDPFGGATVPWRVPARRIPKRVYTSDADLREAYAAAPVVWLSGQLAGRPEPLPS